MRGRPVKQPDAPPTPYIRLENHDWNEIFKVVEQTGQISEAFRIVLGEPNAPKSHSNAYRALRDDRFGLGARFEAAKERFRNSLRKEIIRRGRDGVERMVRFKGEIVGTETEYDSSLLLAAARLALPEFIDKRTEKSVTNFNVNIDGEAGAVFTITDQEALSLPTEQRNALIGVLKYLEANRKVVEPVAAIAHQSFVDAEFTEVEDEDALLREINS